MSDDQEKYQYPGNAIDVDWDGRLCIHMAECGRAKGDLFVDGRQPWCQPDLVPLLEVMAVVKRCPTGALTYSAKEGGHEEVAETENTVTVAYNGPYFIRGDIELADAPDDMPGIAFRTALCRCGKSKSKPFCDNSHEGIKFQDYGAVGEFGEPLDASGSKLSITPLEDGPLLFKGNLTIINGSGRIAWTGKRVALCRCGASANKPFCDGSHVAAGFKTTD